MFPVLLAEEGSLECRPVRGSPCAVDPGIVYIL